MGKRLNKEEQEILDSYEKGEWKSVHNDKGEISKHIEYAEETLRKDKRINIRISRKDLDAIQKKAIEEGIPYQTLIYSIIHKYLSGKLVEKDKILVIKS
ncbi:antitoxin [bacterium]|nr:antitoxin [bacterium]